MGATLGYAQATPEKRVISCIGDGSFQVNNFCLQQIEHYYVMYFVLTP